VQGGMMVQQTTRQIAEYSRLLSQILYDIIEVNFFDELESDQLTKSQFTILKILSVSDTSTVSEIANILRISRAAASKNVEKLVQSRLVKRRVIKDDRRVAEISLSEKGRELVKSYETLFFRKQSRALNNFTNQEQDQLLTLLSKYVANILHGEKDIDLICLQCKESLINGCNLGKDINKCKFYFKLTNQNTHQMED
jgi:DNA-binding MarR family transcriptional regulator